MVKNKLSDKCGIVFIWVNNSNAIKKIHLLLVFVFLMVFGSHAQKQNEKVQIEHNGTWYDGTILEVNAAEGTYYVTYEGWDEGWNEWVTIDRLKGYAKATPKAPLAKFKVGDRVEVEYGMIPEPATIIEVGENKYHIKFDKTAFGDKWVSEGQIKKL